MKTPLHPSSTYSIAEIIGQRDVVGFNVGPGGEVYIVMALKPLDYRTTGASSATFAKTIPSTPQKYRVLALNAGKVELDVVIEHERFNIHDIQPVGNEILLACLRSVYRSSCDFDLNGRIYNRDGTFLRGLLLGDGIESIQATRRGEIWVSYFDEGIFGNFGWRNPVGAAGLIAWSDLGEKKYEFEPAGSMDTISDCYALNVATDDDVWCYYYTEFPIVHLHKKKIVSTWQSPVRGSHAFAVANRHILFMGGYDNRSALQLVQLDSEGKATLTDQFELLSENGEIVIPKRTIGRGERLYILSQENLYTVSLADIFAKRDGYV